jgi:two-component system, OmpR family, sensor kinase
MSLRARLLAGMAALVTAGLALAAVATYEEQRSFLLARVDQEASAAIGPLAGQLGLGAGARRRPTGHPGRRGFFGPLPAVLPPGTFGALLAHGRITGTPVTFSYGATSTVSPVLPASFPLSRPGSALRLFTTGSRGGSGLRYRAAAIRISGHTLLVAIPLREVDQTLSRLVLVEALVGLGVVLALVALGWLVIRVGLRPLQRIGRVASEIAGGNLSRRVAPDDGRTEVGRLGRSLNEMLGQIERAFADRTESEERLRSFLADASHELRTPLSSIRGYAELFRLGAAEDPAVLAQAMERIEAEARRMGGLVEDLLLLARLDELPETRRLPVDLAELAANAVLDFGAIAPGRELRLDAPAPVIVRGDPDQLRQVLANLLRNAVIHTPSEAAIAVSAFALGDRAVLEVRDDGPGLAPESLELVFERFWRTGAGRSRGRGGAGLGLAIVKAIVNAHHGQVTATNAAGGGAVFRLTLALLAGAQTAPSVPDERAQRLHRSSIAG